MTVWFAAAAVATALWALLLLALAVATRTPDITPGPPGAQPADESPAVVDLITGGWRLCDEAASATLLDLAARGAVQIEEVGPELSLVRLRKAEGLNPYEQLVYDHVRSLARDGVVATGALAEGSRNLGRWWKSFRKKVIADARQRGLSQARWSRAHATLLFAAALVPAALVAVAVTVADTSHPTTTAASARASSPTPRWSTWPAGSTASAAPTWASRRRGTGWPYARPCRTPATPRSPRRA